MFIKIKTENPAIHKLIIALATKKLASAKGNIHGEASINFDSLCIILNDDHAWKIDCGYTTSFERACGVPTSLDEAIKLLSPVEKINQFRVLTETPEMTKTLIDLGLKKGYRLGYMVGGTHYLYFNHDIIDALSKDWYEGYKNIGTWLTLDEAIEQLK